MGNDFRQQNRNLEVRPAEINSLVSTTFILINRRNPGVW